MTLLLAAAAAAEPGFLSAETLNFVWYLLLSVLLLGYAILDGFDLGVGINHLFVARNDLDRRVVLNSIGPIWDGNEVWLVTFGGALFAAFPVAYATLFSGFYTAFMLLLLALIMRAVCIEFRSKVEHAAWRRIFDFGFAFGSFLVALLLGVAAGNCLLGMPLDENLVIRQSVFDQLNPFSLLTGLMTVALFALHGSLYLKLRTEGDLLQNVERLGVAMVVGLPDPRGGRLGVGGAADPRGDVEPAGVADPLDRAGAQRARDREPAAARSTTASPASPSSRAAA